MSQVRSENLRDGQRIERSRPSIGIVRPRHIEHAFIALLYLALLILVVLSVFGTFYGLQGDNAPIRAPLQMWRDVTAAPQALAVAFGIQVVLTLLQYGARQFARRDRKWWLLYLAALGISVYYNWQAYWIPLTAMIPAYVAGALIVAGDILPEFVAVRHE